MRTWGTIGCRKRGVDAWGKGFSSHPRIDLRPRSVVVAGSSNDPAPSAMPQGQTLSLGAASSGQRATPAPASTSQDRAKSAKAGLGSSKFGPNSANLGPISVKFGPPRESANTDSLFSPDFGETGPTPTTTQSIPKTTEPTSTKIGSQSTTFGPLSAKSGSAAKSDRARPNLSRAR